MIFIVGLLISYQALVRTGFTSQSRPGLSQRDYSASHTMNRKFFTVCEICPTMITA